MPRSNQPRRRPGTTAARGGKRGPQEPRSDQELDRVRIGMERREVAPDGVWRVRTMTALRAGKGYTCPGCHRIIPPGLAHLVVWEEEHLFGPETAIAERRHWHTRCWSGRTYRFR